MARWDLRSTLLVLVSLAVLLGLLGGLALEAGRPYPGFFVTPDYYVVPIESAARAAGLRAGDRLVAVEGDSPLTLRARVRAAAGPIRYEVERAGRRLSVELAPRTLTWTRLVDHFGVYFLVSAIMLLVGAAVFVQNPAARPPTAASSSICASGPSPTSRCPRRCWAPARTRAALARAPGPAAVHRTAGCSSSRIRPMPTASAGSRGTA